MSELRLAGPDTRTLKEILDSINEVAVTLGYMSCRAIQEDIAEIYDRYGDGWIECDKQLPPDGQLVIGAVCTTDIIRMNGGETFEDALRRTNKESALHPRIEPCWYGHDGSGDQKTVGWYGYDGFPMVCHPRYWMQLPKPPVVEVEDDD